MDSKQSKQLFDYDISKFASDFKVPGINVGTSEIEALTQANKQAHESFQAAFERQAEVLRQTMDQLSLASKDLAEPVAPQDKATKQAEQAKETLERSLSNMRELAEMIAKANNEAVELLNKRLSQNMDELGDALAKK